MSTLRRSLTGRRFLEMRAIPGKGFLFSLFLPPVILRAAFVTRAFPACLAIALAAFARFSPLITSPKKSLALLRPYFNTAFPAERITGATNLAIDPKMLPSPPSPLCPKDP